MTTNPTITQADREALLNSGHPLSSEAKKSVEEGKWDHHYLLQAFARHREQAVAEKDAEIARLRGEIVGMGFVIAEKDKRIAELEAALSEVLDFADQSNVNEYARCPECSDIERVARQALEGRADA